MKRGIESIIDADQLEVFIAESTSDEINDVLEKIFEDKATKNEMIRLEYGKQLVYNTAALKTLKDLVEFLNLLGDVDSGLIATFPTDRLLGCIRASIDVIEKAFRANDKELEVYE